MAIPLLRKIGNEQKRKDVTWDGERSLLDDPEEWFLSLVPAGSIPPKWAFVNEGIHILLLLSLLFEIRFDEMRG